MVGTFHWQQCIANEHSQRGAIPWKAQKSEKTTANIGFSWLGDVPPKLWARELRFGNQQSRRRLVDGTMCARNQRAGWMFR